MGRPYTWHRARRKRERVAQLRRAVRAWIAWARRKAARDLEHDPWGYHARVGHHSLAALRAALALRPGGGERP